MDKTFAATPPSPRRRHACVRTIVYTIPYIRRKNESLTISVHDLSSIENIVQCLITILFLTSQFDETVIELHRAKFAIINSNMFFERICLTSVIFAVAFAAPISESIPTWHLPCGKLNLQVVALKNLEEEMETSLENLRLQHQLTMNEYLNRDYEYLYERVRIGVDDHQYIPNWVPGTKDVNLIEKLTNANTPMVSTVIQLTLLLVYVVSNRNLSLPLKYFKRFI